MHLTDRHYQPALLWARAQQWAQDHAPEGRPAPGPTDLSLQIYRIDRAGAYLMHGPKLYWADAPDSNSFTNCDQSSFAANAATLGEVVLINRRWRTSELLGATYAEAWERLTARPGPGRPPVSETENATPRSIKIPDALWDPLPEPRSESVRQAIREWLERIDQRPKSE